jgi:hypothetical protein
MKKNLLFALLLLAATAVQAQLGIKGGISLASLAEEAFSSSEEYDATSYLGFQGGLFAELPISDGFAIQPEILFIQKGGKLEGLLGETNLRYNYLEVPILAKIKAGSTDGSGIGLFFYGGPFVSYALNGSIEREGALIDGKIDIDFNDSNDDEINQRRIDWGAAFGLGVNLGPLLVDLRYDLGINNLLDDDLGTQGADNEPYLRTRSIGLTLGYVFGGGN